MDQLQRYLLTVTSTSTPTASRGHLPTTVTHTGTETPTPTAIDDIHKHARIRGYILLNSNGNLYVDRNRDPFITETPTDSPIYTQTSTATATGLPTRPIRLLAEQPSFPPIRRNLQKHQLQLRLQSGTETELPTHLQNSSGDGYFHINHFPATEREPRLRHKFQRRTRQHSSLQPQPRRQIVLDNNQLPQARLQQQAQYAHRRNGSTK